MRHSRLREYKTKNRSKNKNKSLIGVVALTTVLLLVSGLVFIFYKVSSLEKYAFVNKNADNSEIVVVDTVNDKIFKLIIPNSVELNSSQGFGDYKLGSIWTLSKKENLGGKLVPETLVKNLNLPLYYWKDGSDTNLGIYKKLHYLLLDKGVSRFEYNEVDLSKTSVLSPRVFEDSSNGFIVTSKLPESLKINFLNDHISSSNLRIQIEDLTGANGVAERVADLITVLGAKVYSNSKGYDEKVDCEIIGDDKVVVQELSNVLGCNQINKIIREANIDIKIRLGRKFSERF